ncbi:hypothetical protein [Streptomyces sp. SID3343]|uniref:hypothetical protein n=1 Tax=Streptomyces sp. SID3343 TaxID=2690260 RepID=UPI001F48A7FE|nr:hypothetical protein [Streptomyces sp. SID3343]
MNARTRWAPVNEVFRIAGICGVIMAAPTPCTTRAAISTPEVGARPAAGEAGVNSTMPTPNSRRLPYRSPSRPAVSMQAA